LEPAVGDAGDQVPALEQQHVAEVSISVDEARGRERTGVDRPQRRLREEPRLTQAGRPARRSERSDRVSGRALEDGPATGPVGVGNENAADMVELGDQRVAWQVAGQV